MKTAEAVAPDTQDGPEVSDMVPEEIPTGDAPPSEPWGGKREYLLTVPTSAQGIVERAMDGTASPRGAIKAMCLTCSGFDRAEVAACTVRRCALFAYRPFQASQTRLVRGAK